MELAHAQEYHNEFLEGYYFVPTNLEREGPGWFVRAGLSQAKPNFHISPKHFSYHYLIFILEGEGSLLQGKKSFHLSPNDLFCLFPQTAQEYCTSPDFPIHSMWIALDGGYVRQLLSSVGLRPQTPYLSKAMTVNIRQWIKEFFEWYRNTNTQDTDCTRMSRFYQLFGLLEKETLPRYIEKPWVQQASEYMRAHYTESITVNSVAQHFHLGRSFFSKKFSAYHKISPGKFLKKLKIEEAKRLLIETDYCIAEIALMVGYADLYSFSKEFKKSFGFPPSHFRLKATKTIMLPPFFSNKIVKSHGKIAKQWLHNFPKLISYCEANWSLCLSSHFRFGSHCLISVKQKDGTDAILKLGVPCQNTYAELHALETLHTDYLIHPIDAEPKRGILLLEKMSITTTLASITDDNERVSIFSNLIQHIHAEKVEMQTHNSWFQTTANWAEKLQQSAYRYTSTTTWILPLIKRTCSLLNFLHAESKTSRLLHGNLENEHILSTANGKWVTISPKGIWAPIEYESVPFLLDNLPKEQTLKVLQKRARLLAQKTGWQMDVLLAWCFCKIIYYLVMYPKPTIQNDINIRIFLETLSEQFSLIPTK
ncbi:MAG TPA: hypothetical protein DEP42_03000 [Ruminococcaceae bacterium]|nr:hypothetical protein [Oscillospiraceae bacterium]